jgi:hypothetical protein
MNPIPASRVDRLIQSATPHLPKPTHPWAAFWLYAARFGLLPVLLLTLILGGAGCGTPKQKPVAWTIKITKPTAIEVDLVGVTAREKPRLESYAMDKYWSPGDLERKNAGKLTSPPQTGTWVIEIKNPIWKQWLGRSVTGVFVIANLPGSFESPDARREFLTLDKNHWDAKRHTLEIEVLENRIHVITPETP